MFDSLIVLIEEANKVDTRLVNVYYCVSFLTNQAVSIAFFFLARA